MIFKVGDVDGVVADGLFLVPAEKFFFDEFRGVHVVATEGGFPWFGDSADGILDFESAILGDFTDLAVDALVGDMLVAIEEAHAAEWWVFIGLANGCESEEAGSEEAFCGCVVIFHIIMMTRMGVMSWNFCGFFWW